MYICISSLFWTITRRKQIYIATHIFGHILGLNLIIVVVFFNSVFLPSEKKRTKSDIHIITERRISDIVSVGNVPWI